MTSAAFARHALIPDWRQSALTSATVVIAGMGALGNEVAAILAMSGVGRLILCDPDRVEASNLSRTVLFRARDIGRAKVDVAAAALRDLAPSVRTDPRATYFQRGVGLADLRDAQLTLGCLDSRAARVDLASRCGLVGVPYIDGGTHPWGGEIRLFLDAVGPCYACALSPAERAEPDVPQSCAPPTPSAGEGAAAPSSAVIGAWMASLAIRVLMGLPVPAGALQIDLEQGTQTSVALARERGCPFHRPIAPITPLPLAASSTIGDLRHALGREETALLWYPVATLRECPRRHFRDEPWRPIVAWECPVCGHHLVPHSTLELDDAPADRTLRELGVPPREILAVRTPHGFRYVELAGASAGAAVHSIAEEREVR